MGMLQLFKMARTVMISLKLVFNKIATGSIIGRWMEYGWKINREIKLKHKAQMVLMVNLLMN